MGIVMNQVRKGLADYLKTDAADDFHSTPGSEKIVELLTDDDFLKAVIAGSKEIDSSWVGNPTEAGLEELLEKMDEVAMQYGGYDALAEAYKQDPEAVLDAISKNDMEILAGLFDKYQPEQVPTPETPENFMEPESIQMFAAVDPDIELDHEPESYDEMPMLAELDIGDMQGGYLLSNDGGGVVRELSAEMGVDPQNINLFSATDGASFGGDAVAVAENLEVTNTAQFTV